MVGKCKVAVGEVEVAGERRDWAAVVEKGAHQVAGTALKLKSLAWAALGEVRTLPLMLTAVAAAGEVQMAVNSLTRLIAVTVGEEVHLSCS